MCIRDRYGTSGSDNIDASLWRETWKTEQITVDGEKVTTYAVSYTHLDVYKRQ